MKPKQKIKIILGGANTRFAKGLQKTFLNEGFHVDFQECPCMKSCKDTLAADAHLAWIDHSNEGSALESIDLRTAINSFFKANTIINVSSDEELMLAAGLMKKGYWDYIKPTTVKS